MPTPQKIPCTVGAIHAHGYQVYSLDLIPDITVPRFSPGQFLHLALDAYDPSGFWPESRVFSIASSPKERGLLKISYSVKGKFTARMEKELSPGSRVWIKMPYGDFNVDHNAPVALIAGGTGITAFTSFLESLDGMPGSPVIVFYGAKVKPLLIYKELIDAKAKASPTLKVFYFLETPEGEPGEEIQGSLSITEIWKRLDAPLEQKYYISGPPGMLKQFSTDLTARGVTSEAILIDAWD